MKFNNFSLRVIGGREKASGYVEITHGQQYSLSMRNFDSLPCDAKVVIGDVHIGTWRIRGNRSIIIERPVNDQGRFTFYKVGSSEAEKIGATPGASRNRLITVTFTPEIPKPVQLIYPHHSYNDPWRWRPRYDSNWLFSCGSSTGGGSVQSQLRGSPVSFGDTPVTADSYEEGVSGLSGYSDQRFTRVAPLDYDLTRQTTISLRLVCSDIRGEPRPLVSCGNPVPPPV